MRNLHLLACLVGSGFAGLAYELIWVRLLALGFGSTTLSFSTVLAVFFGGLALGAWLGGRLASRARRPVLVYAVLEILTGGLALALHPILADVGALFASFDPGPGLLGGLARVAMATPLLIGPTLLMGMTLPFVTRAMVTDDARVGSGSALIYGFNTVGACLGAYLVTYVMLEPLGVAGANQVTVAVNVAVGVLALVFADRRPLPEPAAPAPDFDEVPDKVRSTGGLLAFVLGFSAICFQVSFVRIVSIFLDGTVYGVGSVLIAVLVGIAAGSLLIARPLRDSRDPGSWLAGLQILNLLWLMLVCGGLAWVGNLLSTLPVIHGPGPWSLHLQLVVVVIVLLPASMASGASFPLLMSVVERAASGASRSLGRLYALNTVGSILGSLLTGFVLLPMTGSVATVFIGFVGIALVGAIAAGLLSKTFAPLRIGLAVIPLGLAAGFDGFDARDLAFVGSSGQLTYPALLKSIAQRREKLAFFAEGQAATVVVMDHDGNRSLVLNGLGQGTRRELPPHHIYESLMVALTPMAHLDAPPERALVVGLGAGVTVDALLQLGAKAVEVAELEPAVVEGLGHIFPPESNPLQNPRTTLHLADARHHLLVQRERAPESYDLVTSMPAHPWVASNIFTKEMFELARANLKPEGVFSTWFGLGRMDQEAVDSLVRAFVEVFPNYVIYKLQGAGALYLVGSKSELTVDLTRIEALMKSPLVLEQPAISTKYHLAAQVAATGREGDAPVTPGPVNTDDSAIVELRAPRTATVAMNANLDLLPVRSLRPELLTGTSSRTEDLLELFELMMGSKQGRIPVVSLPARLDEAERFVEAFASELSAPRTSYARGRIALARGKGEFARAELKKATEDPTLAPRARRFLPLTFPSGPEREAALAEAPASSDVWMALLGKGDAERRPKVRAQLPEETPSFEDDRWGWLVWKGLTTTSTPTLEDAKHLGSLAPELAKSNNLGGISLALELAERGGWTDLQAALSSTLRREESRRARNLYARSERLWQDGQREKAAELLRSAIDLDGGNAKAVRNLLRLYVELGNEEGLDRLIPTLHLAGLTDTQIMQIRARHAARRRDAANRARQPPSEAPEGD